MNKKILFIVLIILVAFLIMIGYFFIFRKQPIRNTENLPVDISKITDDEIANFLKTNKDSLNYIERYKDFKIENKILLNKESILSGQNEENFKEVYQDLNLEDNRYLKIDLMNSVGNWGLIAILDLKTRNVIKAFELMLIRAGIQAK